MHEQEKRKFPRICCNVEVEYSIADEGEVYTTTTKDVSQGGMRIISLEELKVGQCLNVKFTMPESKEVIYAKGKVAWTEKFLVGSSSSSVAYDAGVQFLDLGTDALNKLSNLTFKPVE